MDMIYVSLVLLIISLISQLSLFIAAPVASLHLGAPPGAGLHRVKDLVEVAADCPLQLGPGLVKLSQACPHNYNCQTPAAQLYTGFMLLYEVQMAFYDQ